MCGADRVIITHMQLKTVGIIGYGAFGAFLYTLIRRFAPHIVLHIHSRHHEPDGITFFSLEETCASDAVVLAVPIHAFEKALREVLPLIRKETIVLDVATVKIHTTKLLSELAQDYRYVAIHSMFGPESYEKRAGNIDGFRIVITETTLAPNERAELAAFLSSLGFSVTEMSADEHDRHLADTLFLTHFIAQSVVKGGFARTPIDTVSFQYLMEAVESVRHDKKLFADVFRFNPYCRQTLERLGKAEKEVQDDLERNP